MKTLKDLRIERGISQVELANLIKSEQAYISKLESGLHSPTLDTVKKLASTFELSFRYVLDCSRATKAQREARLAEDGAA